MWRAGVCITGDVYMSPSILSPYGGAAAFLQLRLEDLFGLLGSGVEASHAITHPLYSKRSASFAYP